VNLGATRCEKRAPDCVRRASASCVHLLSSWRQPCPKRKHSSARDEHDGREKRRARKRVSSFARKSITYVRESTVRAQRSRRLPLACRKHGGQASNCPHRRGAPSHRRSEVRNRRRKQPSSTAHHRSGARQLSVAPSSTSDAAPHHTRRSRVRPSRPPDVEGRARVKLRRRRRRGLELAAHKRQAGVRGDSIDAWSEPFPTGLEPQTPVSGSRR
jgi:hypothetical protein